MGWGVFEYHDSVHVLLILEIEYHYFVECECGVKYENGVYVHNLFNGDCLELGGIINEPFGNC